jgi:hypothetical protein
MSKEAMQMALEALERYTSPDVDISGRPCRRPIETQAISALRKALAQQGQGEAETFNLDPTPISGWGVQSIGMSTKPAPQPLPDMQQHPAVKPEMLVNAGALKMALNVLRRAGKYEVADELEKTALPPPDREPLSEAQLEVILFLDGSDDLDGLWYGEKRHGEPSIWWRKHLRRAFPGAFGIKKGDTQ